MNQVMLSPGPVYLRHSVLEKAHSAHHRTDSFRKLIVEIERMVREVLGTESPVYVITASGTGVMETAAVNVTRPGSRVLVISGGKFGRRWEEIFDVYNCRVESLRFEPGKKFDIPAMLEKIERVNPECVAVTHVESSTGTLFPLREFSTALSGKGPILLVDAIASLGVEDIRMDEWGIDIVVSAGQKAFASPAGVGTLSLSKRAMKLAEECRRPLYYFSLPRYERGRKNGDTPFTPAIQSVQMLHYSLSVQEDYGWSEMKRRHRESSRAINSAYRHLNLINISEYPSSAVQAVLMPGGLDSRKFVEILAERYNIIVAGGQEELKGRIIRTGFTGLCSWERLDYAVRKIGELLASEGVAVDVGAASDELLAVEGQKDIFS
ncbi:MAG TPA: aminotransferase class V-fold PLP-dependent enzyme [Candidatus Krumholzibacteriaceae bacterium]|nr:aminotransferase class V-fold PLP-dependent enzyme [Candidatus Krumholzibacteriaceae bacterium]